MLSRVSGASHREPDVIFTHWPQRCSEDARVASLSELLAAKTGNPHGPWRQRVGRGAAGRWHPLRPLLWGARGAHRSPFAPERAMDTLLGRRAQWGEPTLGSIAMAGPPPFEGSSPPPTARRPGLSQNPDLGAAALNWPPPPPGRIKAAATLGAAGLVYLLTCAHPSGTTSSLESALKGEK